MLRKAGAVEKSAALIFFLDAKIAGYFMEGDSSIGRALLESRGYGSESRDLSFLFLDAKNSAAFMRKVVLICLTF